MLALCRRIRPSVRRAKDGTPPAANETTKSELDHMTTDDYDKTIKEELAELMKRVEELNKTIAKTRCKCAENNGS